MTARSSSLAGAWARLDSRRQGGWLAALVCGLLIGPGAVSGGELQDDLEARRARLMERLGSDVLFVAFSAPLRLYSRDVEYEYRQDSTWPDYRRVG